MGVATPPPWKRVVPCKAEGTPLAKLKLTSLLCTIKSAATMVKLGLAPLALLSAGASLVDAEALPRTGTAGGRHDQPAHIAEVGPAPATMNPVAYHITNPAPGQEGVTRPFSSAEFFEVDSPHLKMKYAEVAWTLLPPVALPPHIVARYAASSIAITGFEVDVLRPLPGNKTESVPAYQSYNHHYGVTLYSAATKLKRGADGEPAGMDMGHGKLFEYELLRDKPAPPADARLAQHFIHGNGQEHRQMFHGAPPGYAQPLYAPGTFALAPMQISTNDGTGRRSGAGGVLPRIKLPAGATPADPGAKYSPLLECPCTDRVAINGSAGTVNGHRMNGDCTRDEPLSDLLARKNPTCAAATYTGGLACCVNNMTLLDADQSPPLPDFEDDVFFRFRFYFEDYAPSRHQLLEHVEWASNGCDSGCGGDCPNRCNHIEFDVVEGAGSALGADVQVFQSTYKAGDMLAATCSMTSGQCMDGSKVDDAKGFKLMMAASHCHAPNCIRQELLNLDSGEVLCNGTTVLGGSDLTYDEEGYLFTPPCLWGDGEGDGLLPPPVLMKNTTLQMVTVFNSTFWHPGQMGIWQMKAAIVQ